MYLRVLLLLAASFTSFIAVVSLTYSFPGKWHHREAEVECFPLKQAFVRSNHRRHKALHFGFSFNRAQISLRGIGILGWTNDCKLSVPSILLEKPWSSLKCHYHSKDSKTVTESLDHRPNPALLESLSLNVTESLLFFSESRHSPFQLLRYQNYGVRKKVQKAETEWGTKRPDPDSFPKLYAYLIKQI